MPIHKRILHKVHKLENWANFLFTFIHSNAGLKCFSHQWQMCHDFKYFGQRIKIFVKN
jgi:hypothetical protein